MSSFFRDRFKSWWATLDQGQHVALSFLAPCAFLAMMLAGVSLHATITSPFRASKALLRQTDQTLARARASREAVNTRKDTDGDGLTDEDELRTFKTSPYLTDTDSDTVSDSDEIRLGTDPLCPNDRDCYGYTVENADEVPTRATSTNTIAEEGTPPLIERPRPPSELSPIEIRAYLTRNRLATESQVAPLSDEAVVDLYRRAYADLEGASNTVNSPSSQTP